MKVIKTKVKKNVHTRIEASMWAKVTKIAVQYSIDKCDVINTLLTLGLAAHTRHQEKYAKAKKRASHRK